MSPEKNQRQIDADLTFREAALRFPETKPLLEKWPTAKSRGTWSLQQLRIAGDAFFQNFATAAHADIRPTPPQRTGSLRRAVLWISAGLLTIALWQAILFIMFMTMRSPLRDAADPADLAYGATIPYWWYTLQTVQLWGWLTTATMALAVGIFRAGTLGTPASPWGKTARILITLALPVMVATAFFGGPGMPEPRSWTAVAAQALLLAGGILLTLEMLMVLRGRPMDAANLLLLLAAQWMLVWLATAASMQWRFSNLAMWDAQAVRMLTLLPILGFGVHLALALSARLLPEALGLKMLRQRALLLGLAFYETGMIALMLWPGLLSRLGSASTALLATRALIFGLTLPIALFLFLAGFDFLRGTARGPGGLTLRLAFAWLFAGILLAGAEPLWNFTSQAAAPPSYVALYRHMLASGFLGCLLFGLSARTLRWFIPPAFFTDGLANIACSLWNAGVAILVMAEIAVLMGEPRVLWVLAIGGIMQLFAATLLAVILFRAIRMSHRTAASFHAGTSLVAVINARPEAESALQDAGIDLLNDQSRVPEVTVGTVALAWGWRVQELLKRLRGS